MGRRGSLLIGVVAGDGVVERMRATPVTDEFLEIARRGRAPEKRFRFAEECAEGACAQWTGRECGLIGRVLASEPGRAARDACAPTRRCEIRTSCRWFAQEGIDACRVCPLVITDINHDHPGGSR